MSGSTNSSVNSSSSLFDSQSVVGQMSSAARKQFAPKPFESPNPSVAHTGSSIFGGTLPGMSGQPSMPLFGPAMFVRPSSSFSGAPTSTQASGIPGFGQPAGGTRIAPYSSTTPVEKLESISAMPQYKDKSPEELRWEDYQRGDKGSSLFVKKPAFGGFGSSLPSQSSPFSSSTFQPIQSAFGSGSVFCSTSPFGASSQPAFGASSMPTFGSTSTPAFDPTSTPAFDATSTPALSTPAFGSTSPPIFRNTGSSFGVSSSPAFGSTPFGVSTTSVSGVPSTPAFGASTALTFGSTTFPAFGALNTSSFSFGSTPSFGQSTSTFGSTTFGSISSPFGGQSSAFGAPTSTPAYGSPGFGKQPAWGSIIAPYSSTPEVDEGNGTQPAEKLESISAMPQYKDKSHEELRWEDYQHGDQGGPNPSGQVPLGASFTTAQPNHFWTGTFCQPVGNPFSSSPSADPFAMKSSGLASSSGFGGPNPSGQVPLGASFTTAPPNHFWTGTFGRPVGNPFSASADPYAMKSSGLASASGFGGPDPYGQIPVGASFPTAQPNHFWTGAFGRPVGNPFSPSSADPCAMKSSGLASSPGFGSSSSIFSSSFCGPFGSTMSTAPFGSSTTAFGSSSTPLFGVTTASTFSAPSFFSSSLPGSSSSFGRGLSWITQPAGLFQSCTPLFGQTTPAFGQPNTGFQQTTSTFGPSPLNTATAFTGGVFSSSTLPTFSSSNATGFSQPPAPNCLTLVQDAASIQ